LKEILAIYAAMEIETFLGPVKWHGADRQVPFGAQKILGPLPLAQVMDAARIKSIIRTGPYKS
jgi:hypothetical protein